ncbi:glycosyltransferase [Gordonia sp. zg691]|uniref:glycosyltransferase family 2 protein n=1 Tax=Gordonia jinghuaiqii TaxID=2758710 RepID=UPI0016623F64|nr:glycosyltransferase [Gordonia jinghuaiqii]MBD0860226.1 glycosyltransferase [Gordonia jinghuaiqii]
MVDNGQVVRRPGLAPIRRTQGDGHDWDGAVWVGQIDADQIDTTTTELLDGAGFRSARLLVWRVGRPLGFVQLAVEDGAVDGSVLRELAHALPEPPALPQPVSRPGVSVVICTRDRPEHLGRLLASLATLDYPEFEVIVVDNNPASGLTPPVVDDFPTLSVRVVDAVGQGLSIARNVGVRTAGHDLIAFTDDDVVIDPNWLSRLVIGFERDDAVACVCGMVPSAEVMTPSQAYFDSRVGWAQRWEPALFGMTEHAVDDGLFPLRVSEFGTGANFAVRKDTVIGLGGFDEALGAGSAAGGGEDIDIFVRVLLAGRLLAREPSAIVWHSHRETVAELEKQMYNYGVGLSAVICKMLVHPRTAVLVAKRLVGGVRHLGATTEVVHGPAVAAEPALTELRRRELAGVMRGPWELLRGRLAGRVGSPLKVTPGLRGVLDFRRGQMWGDEGNTILAGRLATASVWLGLIGCLAAPTVLPALLQVTAVTAFVLSGPGSLLMSFGQLPLYARLSLIPVLGLAVCIIATTGLLMAGFWHPSIVLALLGSATMIGGLGRGVFLASTVERT